MAPAEETPHISVKHCALMVLMGRKLSFTLTRDALADVERRAKARSARTEQKS